LTAGTEIGPTFDQHRPRLFGLAYRMLGSAADAEDIVQDAFVRWLQAEGDEVRSPGSYLSTVVVRLCIDQLRSARARHETYTGPWLPEPVPSAQFEDSADRAILSESLSFAFLLMLQHLSPVERAVFLLREVFDYDYAEIAGMLDKSEANCRQVLHRAHRRLDEKEIRYTASPEQQRRVTEQFLRAATNGDMEGLLNLLTEDAVFTGDGGGLAPAGRRPVYGSANVARGMLGGLSKLPAGLSTQIEEINGQPAIAGYHAGRCIGVALLDVDGDRVRNIYLVLNPAKLGRFDSRAILD
jgi:RNA polymerase sigma-70 factor (ECF subfamily)